MLNLIAVVILITFLTGVAWATIDTSKRLKTVFGPHFKRHGKALSERIRNLFK